MSIQLENLTPEQVEMCDIMWSFETLEEYLNWYELLDQENQQQADTLQRMIVMEAVEELLDMDQCQDVRRYLKKFML
jgi:hypothetical protein